MAEWVSVLMTRIVNGRLAVVAALVLVLALALGVMLGLPIALLCLAGSVLVGVVFLLWTSLQSLTGETPLSLEEAVGFGAPSAEEERKRAVLRALKDLEYEHSVGKISEEDFRELSARYRQEAKQLLRMLDEGLTPLREQLERELTAHVEARLKDTPAPRPRRKKRKRRAAAPTDPKVTPAPKRDEEGVVKHDNPAARVHCAGCNVANDPDARFCKSCGQVMALEARQ